MITITAINFNVISKSYRRIGTVIIVIIESVCAWWVSCAGSCSSGCARAEGYRPIPWSEKQLYLKVPPLNSDAILT